MHPVRLRRATRGYDGAAVGELVARANTALASNYSQMRASTREELHPTKLSVTLRGFNQQPLDKYLKQLTDRLV